MPIIRLYHQFGPKSVRSFLPSILHLLSLASSWPIFKVFRINTRCETRVESIRSVPAFPFAKYRPTLSSREPSQHTRCCLLWASGCAFNLRFLCSMCPNIAVNTHSLAHFVLALFHGTKNWKSATQVIVKRRNGEKFESFLVHDWFWGAK